MSGPPAKRRRFSDIRQLADIIPDHLPKFSMEELYNPTMITVTVSGGSKLSQPSNEERQKKTFTVPLELLSSHSGWFKSALKGGFKESESKSIDLENVSPQVFELFLTWVYKGTITYRTGTVLLKCYFFADYYNIPIYRQRLLEAIQITLHQLRPTWSAFMTADIVSDIYESTPKGSPLRKTLVEARFRRYMLEAEHDEISKYEEDLVKFPAEFLAEVMKRHLRFEQASKCVHCGKKQDCDAKEEGKPCPVHCRSHEPQDALWGMKQDWCRYHEHSNHEQRRLCAWRYESIRWQFFRNEAAMEAYDMGVGDDIDPVFSQRS